MPVIRTFAPFVAGVGKMNYRTFLTYNVIGGFLWVTALTFIGYFFGGLPIIKKNFEFAVIGIVLFSLLPVIWEYLQHRKQSKVSKKDLEHATYKDIKETFKKEHLSE